MVITPTPKPKSNVVAFPVPVKNQTVWNYYRVTGSWKAVYVPTGELLGEGNVDVVVKVDTRTADEYLVEEFMAAMRDQANLHLLCVRQGFIYKDNMELVEFTVGEDTQAVRQSADMTRIHKKKSEGLQKFKDTNLFPKVSGYTFPWREVPFLVSDTPSVNQRTLHTPYRVEPIQYGAVRVHANPFRRQGAYFYQGNKQRSLERMISNAISPTGRWLGSYDIPELFKGQVGCANVLRSVLKQAKMAAIRVSSIEDKTQIERIEVNLRDTFKFLPQERARAAFLVFHRKDKGSKFRVSFFNEFVKGTERYTSNDLNCRDRSFCPHVLKGIGLSETELDSYMNAIAAFRKDLNEIMNDAMGLL